MRPNTVKNCGFMSIPYTKALQEFKRPTFKTGVRVRISKYDSPFRKSHKPQFTREVFEIVANAAKNPQYTQSRMSKTRLFLANFIKKS